MKEAYPARGVVPCNPDAKVFEPKQRAVIAFNGNEEILILSTDLYASQPTTAIEVIPFPSEPSVKKADSEIFKRVVNFINQKSAQQSRARDLSNTGAGGPEDLPAGAVASYEQIGSHAVMVTRVLSRKGFIEWVEQRLREAGALNPVIPEALKKIVGEYIEKRFDWFVFDEVSLDAEPKTREAVQYRFQTGFLFYPLKVGGINKGSTRIELCVVSPQVFNEFPGISVDDIALTHQPVSLTAREATGLTKEFNEFFGRNDNIRLRLWKMRGNVSSLREDLVAVSYETDAIHDVKEKRTPKEEGEPAAKNNLETVDFEEETPLVKFKDE